MDDGEAEPAAGGEDSRGLAQRTVEIVRVLERHEGEDQAVRAGLEREGGGVCVVELELRRRFARRREHGRRAVDADDVVAECREVAGESALAAADVESPPHGRRHELEEGVTVVAPVVGVQRLVPRPADPLAGVPLPRRGEVVRLQPTARHRARL